MYVCLFVAATPRFLFRGLLSEPLRTSPISRLPWQFLGTKLSLAQQISSFAWADIVIAPHGAALGHSVYMQPGGAIIEIGYPGKELPLIFMATALSAQLDYYLSIAEKGSHASGLIADADDVVELAMKAVASFYISSSQRGHSGAQFNLGNAFANGVGVAQNRMRALEWWNKAAEGGHKEASYTMGYVYLKSDPPNEAKAAEYWQRASAAGHKAAGTALEQLLQQQQVQQQVQQQQQQQQGVQQIQQE